MDITVTTFIIIIVELYNSSFKGKLHDIKVKPQMLALQYTLKLETKPSKKFGNCVELHHMKLSFG